MITKRLIKFLLVLLIIITMTSCNNKTSITTNKQPNRTTTRSDVANTAASSTNTNSKTTTNPTPSHTQDILPTNNPSSTKPLSGLKICIDPGHQAHGNNELEQVNFWSTTPTKIKVSTGTQGISTGIAEYIVNLQISLKLRDKLVALGADVLMIRTNHDVNISNKERAIIGSEFNANVVLRVHCNGSTKTSEKGIVLYTRGIGDGTAAYKQKSEHDLKMAKELLTYLSASTGAKARGVFQSDEYTGINWCSVPCIIIESGFMSNADEDKMLCSEAYQDKLAEGIAQWMLHLNA